MPEVKIGFELEFCSNSSREEVMRSLRALGLRFNQNARTYENYLLTVDGSIRGGNYGHELVSPVFSKENGLEEINKLFRWMNDTGNDTNNSCGFHVGVSVNDPNLMRNLDTLKLLLMFDHSEVLTAFGRSNNQYCPNLKNLTLNSIRNHALNWTENANGWRGAQMTNEERIRRCIPVQKFATCNLGKLPNYVEFRAMGGKVHTKFDQVAATIEKYSNAILSAVDPDRDAELYAARKDRFFERVNLIVGEERERQREEVERRRRAEEARMRPLIERDRQRMANRVMAARQAAG